MSETITDQKVRAEAAVFRKLVKHLAHRTDVQNIDLMGQSGFCRNCLSDWYKEAMEDQGVKLDREEARAVVYGMPYAEWKEKHQSKASDTQLALMEESLKKNEGRGF